MASEDESHAVDDDEANQDEAVRQGREVGQDGGERLASEDRRDKEASPAEADSPWTISLLRQTPLDKFPPGWVPPWIYSPLDIFPHGYPSLHSFTSSLPFPQTVQLLFQNLKYHCFIMT